MRVDYLNIPELADNRNIVVNGRRIVNKAAPKSNVIYLYDRGRPPVDEIEPRQEIKRKAEAPQ